MSFAIIAALYAISITKTAYFDDPYSPFPLTFAAYHIVTVRTRHLYMLYAQFICFIY